MRKFVIIFALVLCALVSTFAFAAMPGNVAPPANALLQFTSGGHVVGFTQNKVYIAGMGNALTEEFINPNTVTPKPLSFGKVIYENLWKGINLTYEARKTGIAESIYTVNPASDVNNIRIKYNAEVTIQNNGTLTFNHPTPQGSYTMSAPIAWQEKEGTRIPVQVAYAKLNDTTIGFTTGPYDTNLPLIIDPVYKWHTFYGSSDQDYGKGIAVDASGNIYVAGYSLATWGTPLNPHSGSSDIVVIKFNSSGVYQWNTFYGSASNDYGNGIAVDSSGNVYVTGESNASWGSPINPHSGFDDIMVLKLNSSGVYQWNTFYGSASNDYGNSITFDTSGNVYVTGGSNATWGSPLSPHSGLDDIMVLKLNNSGVYQWNRYRRGCQWQHLRNRVGPSHLGYTPKPS
jgi:Beta-propeller repeat